MSNVTRLPVDNPRRRLSVPDAPTRIAGAAQDLQEIAAEHQFDRDGILAVAARLRRIADELSAS
ncbi:hypothetical protein [Azospirillum rugosum]|uniref:Uncharacterized protein n=1 Tax=Azospirillum rugosum TaxID=416170 RepID=A0ABS4SDW0_9PROT|nr:hypothetical protein [Azospirillum rugosum]MBP2290744.1 hypothetical protein [Azospirillum rugosum]MDQ0525633.1 hypothetical protein [Azospirillum rugosum]